MLTFYIYTLLLHNGPGEMREAKVVRPSARFGLVGYIAVQLVSLRAHIKEIISAYL